MCGDVAKTEDTLVNFGEPLGEGKTCAQEENSAAYKNLSLLLDGGPDIFILCKGNPVVKRFEKGRSVDSKYIRAESYKRKGNSTKINQKRNQQQSKI